MKKLCIALVFVALLSGCGNMTKGKSAAEAGVATFHQQLNDQNLNAITSTADPEMFRTTSKSDTADFLAAIRKKLGKVTDSQNTNWKIQTINSRTMVILMQNTDFEKGSGTETFTFSIKNQKAYLIGYNINSRDLIMK